MAVLLRYRRASDWFSPPIAQKERCQFFRLSDWLGECSGLCDGYQAEFGLLKSMLNRYHAGNCPSCRQGRLFLFRNLATEDIYGHCEECEWGYITPGDIESKSPFLTLLDDDDAEYATIEEISRSVWANYSVVLVDEQGSA